MIHKKLSQHKLLLGDSSLLALGSAITAVLGFGYWLLAARSFPAAAVGIQSALISAMAFVGLFGEGGLGTMLLDEVHRLGTHASALITAAAIAGIAACVLLATPVAVSFGMIGWLTVPSGVLFVIGCAMTGLSLVVDYSLVAVLRTRLRFVRAIIFSVLKLVLLAAATWLTTNQTAIMASWVAALAVSLAMTSLDAARVDAFRCVTPDFHGLRQQASVVIDHHLFNLASSAPTLLLPLVVSYCLGPAVNAAFYAGWMMLLMATLVPGSLTTVLFSLSGRAPADLPSKLGFSLGISMIFAGITAIVLVLLATPLLHIFNPTYPSLAGRAVQWFGVSLFGTTIKQHYILIMRAEHRMMRGALWTGLGAMLELGLAALAGLSGHVVWLTLAWMFGLFVETGLMVPRLLTFMRPPLHELATPA